MPEILSAVSLVAGAAIMIYASATLAWWCLEEFFIEVVTRVYGGARFWLDFFEWQDQRRKPPGVGLIRLDGPPSDELFRIGRINVGRRGSPENVMSALEL